MYNFLFDGNQLALPLLRLSVSTAALFSATFIVLVFAILLLLASLIFHVRVNAHTSMHTQWIGVGFILFSMLSVVLMALAFPAAPISYPRVRISALGWFVILAVWMGLYLLAIKAPGPWSEEVWWTELGKSVANGSIINPIGFKGDHPANFQAWPVGFFQFTPQILFSPHVCLVCSMRSALCCLLPPPWHFSALSIVHLAAAS